MSETLKRLRASRAKTTEVTLKSCDESLQVKSMSVSEFIDFEAQMNEIEGDKEIMALFILHTVVDSEGIYVFSTPSEVLDVLGLEDIVLLFEVAERLNTGGDAVKKSKKAKL